jgi:hypothetical protein
MKIRLFCVILLSAFFGAAGLGQMPHYLTYQTIVTTEKGNLINAHKCKVTFSIYEDETGGNPIWQETQILTIKKGVLSAVLGKIEPFNFTFDRIYWLGISLKGERELKPRTILTTAAYSFTAMSVNGAYNIFPSDGNVGIGTKIPNAKLEVNGMIHSSSGGYQFPDGSVQTSAANFNADEDTIVIKSLDKVIKIVAGSNAIILDPVKGLIIQCENIAIQSRNETNITSANTSIKADKDILLKGLNVSSEADVNVQVKGKMINVKSSGPHTIQGLPVMIN